MHHAREMGHGMRHILAEGGIGMETLGLLVLAALLAAAVIIVAWLLWSRRNPTSPRDPAPEARTEENIDGQIHSMLTQAGGALSQIEICQSLGLPVSAVAAALRRLEEEGHISRIWQPEGYTYLVRLRSDH